MSAKTLRVSLGDRSYSIVAGHRHLPELGRRLKGLSLGKDAVVVSNATVMKHCGKQVLSALGRGGFKSHVHLIPDSERSKSLRELTRLLTRLASWDGIGRQLFIVALGGGVVGDLAGFAASVYRRGIPYVQIPTTLLAQVDSSIGGKTAVDLPAGKNLVGAIYQPKLVFIETSWLAKLPQRQFASGLAEIIKCSVIRDPALFRFLKRERGAILRKDPTALTQTIVRAARVKASIVAEDETESLGLRTILNFGHTLGHAIEAAQNYKGLAHGEAISVGMSAATVLARHLGLCPPSLELEIQELLTSYRLPIRAEGIPARKIIEAISHDKKVKSGRLRWVLPTRLGHVVVASDVPEILVRCTVQEHLS